MMNMMMNMIFLNLIKKNENIFMIDRERDTRPNK